MATVPRAYPHYTYEEYLALEEAANVRHEFFDGRISAMAGGTPEHAAMAMSVGAALVAQLRGRPCRAYSSDLRVRVLATGLATYPDVSVVCGEPARDPLNRDTVTNPIALVEVLSPSTATYDRTEKLSHYQQIPSLREVILVAHDEPLVEVWSRDDTGPWSRREARAGAIALPALGIELALADVFLAAPAAPAPAAPAPAAP